MNFLASDALRGRGSTTPDELIAAVYIASELQQYGIEPAGDNGGFLQQVPLIRRKFSIPPQLRFTAQSDGEEVTCKHGLDMLVLHVGQNDLSGPLQKITPGTESVPAIQKGAFVLLMNGPGARSRHAMDPEKIAEAGAAAVLVPENSAYRARWQDIGERLFSHSLDVADSSGTKPLDSTTVIMLSNEAAKRLAAASDGTSLHLVAPEHQPEKASTWNVLGEISGVSSKLKNSVVLLSAHLDHLGIGPAVAGDDIYNGADDDASGTSAVLELARVLAKGPRPRRTVIFALFGSEEAGELGSTYFLTNPPVPLESIAANLEFEMIGRADPAVPENTLWLTGWNRSNLGPELAAHGAHLVADPHPQQHFFRRSDNFVLAKKGVVAQTVSSFGLHSDYHQPSDELAHIDFEHMNSAISALLGSIEWLVNSSFQPAWSMGGQP